MQVVSFLHKFVSPALPNMHKTRLNALIDTTGSLLNESQLTLTDLGRHMRGTAKVKHKIKRVDRLLSNKILHVERFDIYQALINRIFAHLTEALIIVDWSGCCSQERWILQASLVASGRSIPIYREIHPLKLISNLNIEKQFLDRLHKMIPKTINVIILTDAGFRLPFLKYVRSYGWDFVARIRAPLQFSFNEINWQKIKEYNGKIAHSPTYLGKAFLGKQQHYSVELFGYQGQLKGRKMYRKKYHANMYPDKNIKYGRSHREPWVIATSLLGGEAIAQRVINIYKKRMQIEQNFRDEKNPRWGFGLRMSRTENIQRLEILLLISFIATVILWLIGNLAESKNMHRDFQANSYRHKRVLSVFSLGIQIIRQLPSLFSVQSIKPTFELIRAFQSGAE
jgi:hypothetical protein